MNPIKRWKENRAYDKAKKESELVAAGFWELHAYALTYHGRKNLYMVVHSYDTGELSGVDPALVNLYRVILDIANYQAYATIN